MRRIRFLALVLAVVVLAAACHETGKHWPRTSDTQSVVYVQSTPQIGWRVHDAMVRGAKVWNNRLNNLEFRIVSQCPADEHCAVVKRAPISGARVVLYGAGMHYTFAEVLFDDKSWQQSVANNAACHELGHVAGLGHADGTPWPCDGKGFPETTHEAAEVDKAHAHKH